MVLREDVERLTDREISATTRWGISLVIALLVQAAAIFFWAASVQSQVEQNKVAIDKLDSRVSNIDGDIRNILIGIEQVKARLGIIEK